MNRDGFHRQTISKGRVNYEQHAVEALQFELAKDGVTAVRTRMRSNLVNVHPDLARRVAEVPGLAVPAGRARTPAKRHAPSPSPSMLARGNPRPRGASVAPSCGVAQARSHRPTRQDACCRFRLCDSRFSIEPRRCLARCDQKDRHAVNASPRPLAVATGALFANAGHGLGHAFLDQPFDRIRCVIDANVTGTLSLVHALGIRMRGARRGRILLTGSIAGFMPGMFQAVYNATKAFVDSFSWALRNEPKDTVIGVGGDAPQTGLTGHCAMTRHVPLSASSPLFRESTR